MRSNHRVHAAICEVIMAPITRPEAPACCARLRGGNIAETD
jgi:hypothetical protein